MKKTMLLFMLVFAAELLQAQIYVDGKDISTGYKGHYLIINEGRFVEGNGSSIEVDYGQETTNSKDDEKLTDSKGKALGFLSIVGALNYFYEQGWELQEFMLGVNYSGKKYLLKRK